MVTLDTTALEVLEQTIDRFWETIPPVWGQIRENVRAIATQSFDITVEQFHILRHVRKGVRSMSELASVRQISRPAISQSVDALVDKGLLTRHPSMTDRRYVELKLTPRGTSMLDAIFERNHAWMRQKLATVSPEELDDIILGMNVLKKTFAPEERPAITPAGDAVATI
jgi:DNA-binding MarR family transcriptional regulator